MKKIKVLLVDDSAVVRQTFTEIINKTKDIEVVGSVMDPLFAMERMKLNWPDVIVLDIEMPRMDGITFLKKIMEERPTPIIICSTLTSKGSETTLEALSAGAIAIVNKPTIGVKDYLSESSQNLTDTIRTAAQSKPKTITRTDSKVEPKHSANAMLNISQSRALTESTEKVIAIGTSTGGTQALEYVLPKLPRVIPGIVIVQHMPEKFTKSFADRLNQLCELEVKEACDGDVVLPGSALIAPGGRHMMLTRRGGSYYVTIKDGPLVNRHRPSVDVLFRSVANTAGRNAYGIIMTGMGDDGARGLKEMLDAGARTFAQNEKTCVVYGMPKEAVAAGAVEEILPLEHIPQMIKSSFSRPAGRISA